MASIECSDPFFADMPENERAKEEERLKDYVKRYETGLAKVKEGRSKFNIK